MIRVTVVIPTYRGRACIRTCLDSVLPDPMRRVGIMPRVVVFDNASSDGTRGIVQRAFPQVELIRSPRNVGFARAANHVIRRAISRGDDYVFLLNEDARVEPDTLAALVETARTRDVAALSPLQYDDGGETLESDFKDLLRQAGVRGNWRQAEFIPTVRVIGAAVLLDLRALRRVGLFDPIYFVYAEEEDLCLRLLRHGYKVGITPKARVFHGHRATGDFLALERFRRFNIIRGKYILALKNPNQAFARALVAMLAQVARDFRRLFLEHRLAFAWEFALAAVQVASELGRIRRRRQLERDLSPELWTRRELGTDVGPDGAWG